MSWKTLIFGPPLKESEAQENRVSILGGLSLLAPDALSSVAYGTQEILIPLAAVGTAALWYSLPISLLLTLLLAFLVVSYRQVIRAYPGGGGAYVVGRDNLGVVPSLLAGAALLIDYILTVAVSVTAGVAALVAAFPALSPFSVGLSILVILGLMLVNLRGVRESAALFAPPTYLFIVLVLSLVFGGLFARAPAAPPLSAYVTGPATVHGLTLLLLLRAFSSGSSALTGIESISNGVPVFKSPSGDRARTAMLLLGLFLGSMFLGTSIIAYKFGVIPNNSTTVLQQLAADIYGKGWFFYFLSFITMSILAVAANTSFTGFPQLTNLMAKDKWVPRMFLSRGDRLVHQNGIIVLSVVAMLLVWMFNANTNALIPLYAIGVYLSFTIAQIGLARKHITEKTHNIAAIVTASTGAALTGVVVIVSAVSKFTEGAYVVVIAIPLLLLVFRRINRHYAAIAEELRLPSLDVKPQASDIVVIVPFASINKMTVATFSYALSISDRVVAVNVGFTKEREKEITDKWQAWNPSPQIRLVVLESQYRSVIRPILRFIDHLSSQVGKTHVMVLIPEFVVGRFWQHFMHNQLGLALQATLVFRKDIVVAMVPYHLSGR